MAVWKQILVLLLLIGLGAGAYEGYRRHFSPPGETAASRGGPREISVEVALVESVTLPRTVEAVGTTRARQSIQIVPLASGRVVEIAIRPGQPVNAGDVLVRLDDDIERANLVEAEAMLVEQHQAVERAERLQRNNAVSLATLEQATSAKAVAEAAVERARRRLADRVISAPFAGMVGLSSIDLGARVDDQTVITTLDDLAEVEVEFSLPETLFAEVVPGQRITTRSAAFPDRSFSGSVIAIDSRVDPVSRAFKVRALIPNPEGLLPSGMFMFLTITLSEAQFVVVPEEAVMVQATESFVFVIDGAEARRRVVETGPRRAGLIAILSGLEPGETVVIRGMQRLRDGAPVKILGEPVMGLAATRAGNGT
jgi:membrane fusion protein (multidrug efflux system)